VLCVGFFYCYAECHYIECRVADSRGAVVTDSAIQKNELESTKIKKFFKMITSSFFHGVKQKCPETCTIKHFTVVEKRSSLVRSSISRLQPYLCTKLGSNLISGVPQELQHCLRLLDRCASDSHKPSTAHYTMGAKKFLSTLGPWMSRFQLFSVTDAPVANRLNVHPIYFCE